MVRLNQFLFLMLFSQPKISRKTKHTFFTLAMDIFMNHTAEPNLKIC